MQDDLTSSIIFGKVLLNVVFHCGSGKHFFGFECMWVQYLNYQRALWEMRIWPHNIDWFTWINPMIIQNRKCEVRQDALGDGNRSKNRIGPISDDMQLYGAALYFCFGPFWYETASCQKRLLWTGLTDFIPLISWLPTKLAPPTACKPLTERLPQSNWWVNGLWDDSRWLQLLTLLHSIFWVTFFVLNAEDWSC